MQSYAKRRPFGPGSRDQQVKKPRLEEHTTPPVLQGQYLPKLPLIRPEYAKPVFTHSSLAVQDPDSSVMVNYERLEFLGDAQLEHLASLVIFSRYSSAAPGKMSTIRELLVRNEALCEYARAYGFDKKLQMADTPHLSKERIKIYADVFEAYVAAVILSNPDPHAGFDDALAWMTALWEPKLKSLGMIKVNNKSKEELAKKVLVKTIKLNYREERPPLTSKKHGTQTYFVGVYLDGWGYDNQHLGSGEGSSKKEAEQDAAAAALANSSLLGDIITKRTNYLEQRKLDDLSQQDVKPQHDSADPSK